MVFNCKVSFIDRFLYVLLFNRQLIQMMSDCMLLQKVGLQDQLTMDSYGTDTVKDLDQTSEEEYATQSKLIKEFITIPSIDKAWIFNSGSGPQAMVAMSQANLLANKRRKFMLSGHISKESSNLSVNFHWAPFPVEMTGASAFAPSPSGLKLLVVRNPDDKESPTKFEIWSSSQLEKEFHIPQKVHGSVYVDGWFEGISWNSDETCVAYVAEEPSLPKPTFDHLGYYTKDNVGLDKAIGSWKGQGDWEEEWGEAYAGKRQPALFVINVDSGEVEHIKGVPRSISVGQVVWSPSSKGVAEYLVFAGWLGDKRKFGIKYCYNRPCSIYAIKFRDASSGSDEPKDDAKEAFPIHNLTKSISSGFSPLFSKDGKFLLFLSAKTAVDSGAHWGTESLHKINWPSDGKLSESTDIVDLIPVVNCPDDGCFPGLYVTGLLSDPWLSDGHTLMLSSYWHSCRVILSLNMLSGELSRASPNDSDCSWSVLALDGDDIVAVCSSPVSVPEIKYGKKVVDPAGRPSWQWLDIQNPIFKSSEKVTSGLSSLEFKILKVPISNVSECLTKGAKKPIEAIYVSSSKSKENGICDPLAVIVHGGPHSIAPCSFSKTLAYLSSIGYSLLIVNYRGSLGFGEDALQSLPGKVGSQDVNDVLSAVDHAVEMGLADPSRITVLGGSHGGFLTTHLIGQAPNKFVAAAARNPVCNLASMVGITDIPDWCFFEAYGDRTRYTEAPSPEDMSRFHQMSPISHISKVKTPTLFLLGTMDLRVPISNGIQYVRALKEKGIEVKVLVFPNDNHPLDRPQTDYESFLNIAVWFNKYCKL
ncbi:acylamino-acid-releasing enzyme-like isoform X2 [Brassica napus]|uniref:acylamino-acid-releasing enzyme isoform X2 n=1 Tax=Brassica napus TaxID=3708 RepID=UPI002078B3F0|nr:acylamino-acid-releasing enzyme isoform X2 [Brassica napus]XP_048626895.1 acylamino-acid-releasing enzyme-like isoform X2 [Brassica napus]